MVYHDRQHLMGMAYHPTRWKFVEQQVVFEVIVQPYIYHITIQCWTIMWGEVRKKNISLARGFSRFGEIVSNWDMKLYHALPTSSTSVWLKWLLNSCEEVSAQKCADQSPNNLSKLWLDMAWRGFHMLRLHSPHHPAVDDHILTDGLWPGAANPSEAATSPGCSADPRGARNERPAP